jgi:hypothetical protein
VREDLSLGSAEERERVATDAMPFLEPRASRVLASGFSEGSVAQSPGAALRDVDPSAIREVAVLFNSLRNAYLQHRRQW